MYKGTGKEGRWLMRLKYFTLCAALLALCGCNEDARVLDTNEENNQFVKQGQAYMDMKDWDQAEQSFLQAITTNPLMAKPHLDLATIYQQHKIDYMNAIYHYKRYLALRPQTEKTTFIVEQVDKVQHAWAEAIYEASGIKRALSEGEAAMQEVARLKQQMAQLRQENAALNQSLADMANTMETTTSAPAQTQTRTATPVATAELKPTSKEPIIYTVVENDTLSGIAKKFYGSSGKWDLIYEANKQSMIGPGDLRIGQTLVIPAPE